MIKPEDYYKYIETIKDEDLKQDCYLFLLKLIKKAKGTPKDFERYFHKSISGFKKDYYKAKNNREFLTVSIDENTPANNVETYADLILDSADLEQEIENNNELDEIKKNSTRKEFIILQLFHEYGLTAKEIYTDYKDLNIRNEKQIYNIVLKYKK